MNEQDLLEIKDYINGKFPFAIIEIDDQMKTITCSGIDNVEACFYLNFLLQKLKDAKYPI